MQKLTNCFEKIILGFFMLWAILVAFRPNNFPDYWWQVEEGLWLLGGKAIDGPLYAFGLPAAPYPHEYRFYELLIGTLYHIGGHHLVWISFGILIFCFLAPLACLLYKRRQDNPLWFVPLAFIFVIFYIRINYRAEIAAILALVGLGYFLCRYSPPQPRKPIWFWLIIFASLLIWSNSHSSYILGIFMLGCWALWQWFFHQRNRDGFYGILFPSGLICLITPFLHPDGWLNLLRPLLNQSNKLSVDINGELWPPSPGMICLSVIMLFCGLKRIFSSRDTFLRTGWLVFLLLALFVLGMISMRHIALLASCLLLILLVIKHPGKPFLTVTPVTLFAICLAFASWIGIFQILSIQKFIARQRDFAATSSALNWLADHKPQAFMMSDVANASFAQTLNGRLHPFQDTCSGHYAEDNLRYYYFLQLHPEAVAYALDHLEVDAWVIDEFTARWLWLLYQPNSKWKLIHANNSLLIFERNSQNSGRPIALPEHWLSYLKEINDLPVHEANVLQAFDLAAWNRALKKSRGVRPQEMPVEPITPENMSWFQSTTERLNQRIDQLRTRQ
ncbi:MAG: hypothetical protein LBH01_05950 [Verrucomicrobiales bacterium]|nr:hypothetical protein [Verrucomicrobiales bacterium]